MKRLKLREMARRLHEPEQDIGIKTEPEDLNEMELPLSVPLDLKIERDNELKINTDTEEEESSGQLTYEDRMCSTVSEELERIPIIKSESVDCEKENTHKCPVPQLPEPRKRRKPTTEERFKRKFEWGSYYEKYNISKSSTVCPFDGCKFIASHSYSLELHIRGAHEGIYDFSCLYCKKPFRMAAPCQKHEIKCPARPKQQEELIGLLAEDDNLFECSHCREAFPNKRALTLHCNLLHSSHNEMVAQLNVGSRARIRKRFPSGKSSKIPQIKVEPGVTPGFILQDEDGSDYCGLCGRDVAKHEAEEHVTKFHCDDPPRFYCNLCDKNYTQKAHLKKHCLLHHYYTSDEFNDEHPRPGFRAIPKADAQRDSDSTPSRRSRRTPSSQRRSTDSSSPTKSAKAYKHHSRTGHKRHPVTIEGLFVLKRADELDKVFECACCGELFDNKADFTTHVRKKHRAKFRRSMEDGLLTPRKRRLATPLTRSDSIEKDMHSESSSSGDSLEGNLSSEVYPCRFCGRCFESKANRIVHERLHTGEKPFQCTVCEKSFPCFTYLTSHLERAHNLLKG